MGLASNGFLRRNLFYVVDGGASAAVNETHAPAPVEAMGATARIGSDGGGTALALGAVAVQPVDGHLSQIREARMKGYAGDACGECGNFTLVRNGTCLKCDTCGGTSGCS